MDLGLKGKKVIVTGGSRGIGRSCLEHFVAEGCDVAFFSRNAEQVEETAEALRKGGTKVFAEAFEVGDLAAYKAWLVRAADALGGVDVFVHNISSSGAGASGDWAVTLNLDIMGAVAGCEALLPYLAASECGSAIFMSSTAALETFFAPTAFNALKAALLTYSKQLSQAWGEKGIRVNSVSPGPVKFPGGNWTRVEENRPEVYAASSKNLMLGRFGRPEEVARSVVFLASPMSSFTTGANLVIDGGFTKRVNF